MLRIKRLDKIVDRNIAYELFLNDIKLGEIKNDDTLLYDLKNGDYNLYVKCGEMVSEKVTFSYDDHSTIEIECYPKYSENKMVKLFFKTVMKKKGIALNKVKDFYV